MAQQQLKKSEATALLAVLQQRFDKNRHRHSEVSWETVIARVRPEHLWSLQQMEDSGGEPDVVVFMAEPQSLYFIDCAAESPKGRRSLCYDDAALEARKENKPLGSAIGLALEMGVALLTEDQYRGLQELEPFDLKTSSWIITPEAIRKLDGALFCDRRYNHTFTYHNGASSYYAARGFRAVLSL
jgi:hypothetical protein